MKKMILFVALMLSTLAANAVSSNVMTSYDCTTELNTKISLKVYLDRVGGQVEMSDVTIGEEIFPHHSKAHISLLPNGTLTVLIDRKDGKDIRLLLSKEKSSYQIYKRAEQPLNCNVHLPTPSPEDKL